MPNIDQLKTKHQQKKINKKKHLTVRCHTSR